MNTKNLRFQKAVDVQDDVLSIEAVDEGGNILFCIGFDERTSQIEIWFTKNGAHVPFEIEQFQALIDEQVEVLRCWAQDVKD